MAMMQKQLYETAHRAGGAAHSATTSTGARSQAHSVTGGSGGAGSGGGASGLQGGIGPLAILNHKLCHDEL